MQLAADTPSQPCELVDAAMHGNTKHRANPHELSFPETAGWLVSTTGLCRSAPIRMPCAKLDKGRRGFDIWLALCSRPV